VDLDIDVHGSLEVWRHGSVVRSWLLDLLVDGVAKDPGLESVTGWADDSGEGRWTVEEAIANAVPAPAISAALFARFAARQEDSPAMRAIATLRNEFGGHAVRES
jgi:6-phosphogluconate dehydrogenase